jgi:hypothetical protein
MIKIRILKEEKHLQNQVFFPNRESDNRTPAEACKSINLETNYNTFIFN